MPVDIASGNVHLECQDVVVDGQVPLVWERRYSGAFRANAGGTLGAGWISRYDATLTRHPGGFAYAAPSGSAEWIDDPSDAVDRGGTVALLGAFLEVYRLGDHYVVRTWGEETGAVWVYRFPAAGLGRAAPLASVEDPTGQGLDLVRDADGRLRRVRQRLERRELGLSYGADGRLSAVALYAPDGESYPVARYEYDAGGRLTAAFDALGSAERYEYDAAGRLAREVARDGSVFAYRYDAEHRCVRVSGLDRYDEKRLRFVDAARTTEVRDSDGATSVYRHLPSGQLVAESDPLGGVTRTEYDAHGRIVAVATASGRTTTYAYDERGNRAVVRDSLGNAFSLRFNDARQPTELVDPNGNTWTRSYDARNRVVGTTDPLGNRWTFEYDDAGNVVALVNPKRDARRFAYADGSLTYSTDWAGNVTRFEYDGRGLVIGRTDPAGHRYRYRYDAAGRVVQVVLPDGTDVAFEYNAVGEVVRSRDPAGRVTTRRYGTCRRLVQRVDPNGRVVTFEWGTEPGRLRGVVNESGERHEYEYDLAGRCTREVGFDGRVLQYAYDADGLCVRYVNAAGEAITFERDALGRVVARTLPDGSRTRYEYDGLGNLTAAINDECPVRFERDALGRLTREIQGDHWVRYVSDALGEPTGVRTDLGLELEFELDPNGLRTALRAGGGGAVLFRYDALGAETQRVLPGNVRMDARHDALGRFTEQRVTRSRWPPAGAGASGWNDTRGDTLVRRTYERDRAGAVTAVDEGAAGSIVYGYDPAGHLLRAVRDRGADEWFEYDPAGNLTRHVVRRDGVPQDARFAHGAGGRLLRRGATSYAYDVQGRLVEKIDSSDADDPKTWRYTWDALDQLRSVVRPDGEVWTYGYDPFSRRIRKSGPRAETTFVWSGDTPIHELSEPAAEAAAWLFAQRSFVPVARLAHGRLQPVVTDAAGTPREMLDEAGRVVWRDRSLAYGVPDGSVPSEASCPLRFQGQWADDESGLHYSRFRYYDPETARFVSADPLVLQGGLNLYAYAPNPTEWVDPWGLLCQRLAQSLPESAGIYHIELNGQKYTGSAVNVRGRLSASDHPAAALLNDPNVKVTVYPVKLGGAAGDARMSNHVLRGFEQGVMDRRGNVPNQNGSLNAVRAAKANRVGEYKQDAASNNASRGRAKSY